MRKDDHAKPTASMQRLSAANALTATRLCLTPLLGWQIVLESWWTAAMIMAVAVVTDIYDGRLARARGTVSAWGGLFDHGTDALLVSTGIWALANTGLINSWLWPLILIAFLQYALDSKALSGQVLRTSKLGKYNGIGYYVLLSAGIGISLFDHLLLTGQASGVLTVLLDWLNQLLNAAAWLLLLTTIASITDRLFHLLRK
jgi:phosphatidylglycerophosphate synthase